MRKKLNGCNQCPSVVDSCKRKRSSANLSNVKVFFEKICDYFRAQSDNPFDFIRWSVSAEGCNNLLFSFVQHGDLDKIVGESVLFGQGKIIFSSLQQCMHGLNIVACKKGARQMSMSYSQLGYPEVRDIMGPLNGFLGVNQYGWPKIDFSDKLPATVNPSCFFPPAILPQGFLEEKVAEKQFYPVDFTPNPYKL